MTAPRIIGQRHRSDQIPHRRFLVDRRRIEARWVLAAPQCWKPAQRVKYRRERDAFAVELAEPLGGSVIVIDRLGVRPTFLVVSGQHECGDIGGRFQ